MRYVKEKSLTSDQTDRLSESCELTPAGIVHYILHHPTTVFRVFGTCILIYAVIISLTLFFGA